MHRRTLLRGLAASTTLLAACGRSDRRVIGVAPKGTNSIYWQAARAGALAAGEEFGVDILWNGPPDETEYARQIQIVETMLNRRVAGLVLSPTDENALVGVVKKARAAGVPVTVFDSGIATDDYVSFVATDNRKAGAMAAETIAELTGGGEVGMVMHVPGSASTSRREEGFEEAVAERFSGLEIVNRQYCQSDRARALAVTEDMLTAHPELAALFCSSEAATVGASQAVRARGVAGRVKVVGFDASPRLQQSLADGVIDALVVQNPYRMTFRAVETVLEALAGRTPPKRIDSPARVVRATDLDDPEVQRLLNPV